MTPAQRRGALALLCIIAAIALVRFLNRPTFVNDPLTQPRRYADLADKIDPNTASVDDLASLPNIGRSRAQAIVEFRESIKKKNPDAVAFRKIDDLQKVRGIGQAISNQLLPYLKFPVEPPPPAVE